MEKLLEIKNLRVSYHTYAGEVQSVRGIDFSLNLGETLAIVGESGCGKSVTAKSIMGLIQTPGEIKEHSKIIYKGENLLDFTEEQWQNYRGAKSSIIFQDALASLNPTLSIGKQITEKLQIHSKMSKEAAKKEAINLLELVGITSPEKRMKQYPHEFSGGMRQRVMIAIALACNPELLIADEPTTALDVTIQADIMDLIQDLQKKLKMSVILITHDLGVVAEIAEKALVMYAGKIVESGTCKDIFYKPKHPYTKALLKAVPRLNMDENQSLYSILGAPPNMINPPKGCAFSPRCTFAMKICLNQEPPTFEFNKDHTAMCWLYHPMVTKEKGAL